MTERNKNNRIIFLTTLSVYLGLVLVGGATPSVLAQAATAKIFNVQDEIEVRDDLDNKPDDSKDFQEIYAEEVFAEFIEDLRSLQKNQFYNLVEKKDFCKDRLWVRLDTYGFYARETPDLKTSQFYAKKLSSLEEVLAKLLNSLDTERLHKLTTFSKDVSYPNFVICTEKEESKQENTKLSSYSNALTLGIYTDDSEIKLKTYLVADSEQRASLLTDRLNAEFFLRVNKTRNNFAKRIYENTKVSTENNQVIIVTRLPRGSLDELLKQDAKAENE